MHSIIYLPNFNKVIILLHKMGNYNNYGHYNHYHTWKKIEVPTYLPNYL